MSVSFLFKHPIYKDNKTLFNNFIKKSINKDSSLSLLNAFLTFIDTKTTSKKKNTRINYNIRVTFFCLLDLFTLCGFSKKIIKLPNNIIRLINSIQSGHRPYTNDTIIISDQNVFSCDCGCYYIIARFHQSCKLDYCPYQSDIISLFNSGYSYECISYKSRKSGLKYYEHYIINKILCIDYDELIFIGQPIGRALICKWEKNICNTINIDKYNKICKIFLLREICNLIFSYYY
jgi:hypothetical protein